MNVYTKFLGTDTHKTPVPWIIPRAYKPIAELIHIGLLLDLDSLEALGNFAASRLCDQTLVAKRTSLGMRFSFVKKNKQTNGLVNCESDQLHMTNKNDK